MAEELQHLIDRFQKEAVDAAEKKAADIVAKAKQEAATVVREAEEKAKKTLEKADHDAEAFTVRSIKTLEQAARDLLITVGKGVENIISEVVTADVKEAMTIKVLEQMLVKLAAASAERPDENEISVLLSKEDQAGLVQYCEARHSELLRKGVELKGVNDIFKGFKICYVNGTAYHEFTYSAIADAVSNFLRPHLAEIVHRVAGESSGK